MKKNQKVVVVNEGNEFLKLVIDFEKLEIRNGADRIIEPQRNHDGNSMSFLMLMEMAAFDETVQEAKEELLKLNNDVVYEFSIMQDQGYRALMARKASKNFISNFESAHKYEILADRIVSKYTYIQGIAEEIREEMKYDAHLANYYKHVPGFY